MYLFECDRLKDQWSSIYMPFSSGEREILEWLRDHGLLARTIPCHKCGDSMSLEEKADRNGARYLGAALTGHTRRRCGGFLSSRKLTLNCKMRLFSSSHTWMTLLQWICIRFDGCQLNWVSYIRDLFKEYYHRYTRHRRIGWKIEIDQSIFGWRVKFHPKQPEQGPESGYLAWLIDAHRFESSVRPYRGNPIADYTMTCDPMFYHIQLWVVGILHSKRRRIKPLHSAPQVCL